MKSRTRIVGAALGLLLLGQGVFACPTCRDALARADARWAHGFSVSVVFLLTALVAIVGTFSFAVWRANRS